MNNNFAEFGKLCIPFTGSFLSNTDINFVYMLARALRKIIFLQCWYKLLQFISPHIHYIVQMQGLCPQPWNTFVGLADPGQKRSFTWKYGSGSRRAFNSSVASFFVWLVIGAIAVMHALLDFSRERVRHEFGSRWPDIMISVRWWVTHNPTIWFMGAELVKCWNSLRACFYGRVSSIQNEKFFAPIVFFMSNWILGMPDTFAFPLVDCSNVSTKSKLHLQPMKTGLSLSAKPFLISHCFNQWDLFFSEHKPAR